MELPELGSRVQQTRGLYSAYLGHVNIGTNMSDEPETVVLEGYGVNNTLVKIIDVQEHNLQMNYKYSLSFLQTLSSKKVSIAENRFVACKKLYALYRLYQYHNKDTSKIQDFLSDFEDAIHEQVLDHYPDYRDILNPPVSEQLYKERYHHALIDLAPVDIYFNCLSYIQFLQDTLGEEGFHTSIPMIICLVNVPDLENAYWSGEYAVFGNGKKQFYPLASVDVVGHELSHCLVEYTANLSYSGHAGAINEGYADIYGSIFELYVSQYVNKRFWYIGEDIIKDMGQRNIRNLKDPHKSSIPQPKSYKGKHYISPKSTVDNGGVHINSGIVNYLFYRLACKFNSTQKTLVIFYKVLQSIRNKHCKFKHLVKTFHSLYRKRDEWEIIYSCLKETNLDQFLK